VFERLTSDARTAVAHAQQAASDLGATAVEPEHLLLSLLRTPGLAADVLSSCHVDAAEVAAALAPTPRLADLTDDDADALATVGIDLEAVLEHLGATLPPHALSASRRPRRRRLSAGSRRTMHLAVREAMWLKSRQIGTEHLLLGLLRVDDRRVAQLIGRAGSTSDEIRVATLARLGRAA
jgi:ATP-dependent Clp protease ATP-binding subunit ClpA